MTRPRLREHDVALLAGAVTMASVATRAVVGLAVNGAPPLRVVALAAVVTAFVLLLRRGPLSGLRAISAEVLALASVAAELGAQGDEPLGTGFWALDAVACITLLLIWRRRRAAAAVLMIAAIAMIGAVAGVAQLPEIGTVPKVLVVAVIASAVQVLTWYAARIAEYADAAREAIEWRVAQDAYQVDHQQRIEQTGRLASGMLQRIIAADGRLDPSDRAECRLLHQSIRDETRGRHLLNDAVRHQVLAHRRRGATVTLLDDGRLSRVDAVALDDALEEVAARLAGLHSDVIVVRSASAADAETVSVIATSCDPVAAALGEDDAERLDLRFEQLLHVPAAASA